MGPPLTRSQSRKAGEGSSVESSTSSGLPPLNFVDEIRNTLVDIDDFEAVPGRSARETTATAVTEAWQDARFSTASLAQQINDNNPHLLNELNMSFAAMGTQHQPRYAMCPGGDAS